MLKKVLIGFFIVTVGATAFSGCAGIPVTGQDGTIHHLIIGIGVVTVPGAGSPVGVMATKSEVVGLQISDQPGLKLAAGYATSSAVAVPETADNVLVEVSNRLFGPLIIELNPHFAGGNYCGK